MNTIRTTITPKEFEKLTWMDFSAIASDINDIFIELKSDSRVYISVLGYELTDMNVQDYKAIIN